MSKPIRSATNAKISVSLTKEMLDALDAMAKRQNRSRSNMFQQIIMDSLAKEKQQKALQEFRESIENSLQHVHPANQLDEEKSRITLHVESADFLHRRVAETASSSSATLSHTTGSPGKAQISHKHLYIPRKPNPTATTPKPRP